jgi:hypothetical protein
MKDFSIQKYRGLTIVTTLIIWVAIIYHSLQLWSFVEMLIASPIALMPFVVNIIFSIRLQKKIAQIPLILGILFYALLFFLWFPSLSKMAKSIFVLFLLVPYSLVFMFPLWILSLILEARNK